MNELKPDDGFEINPGIRGAGLATNRGKIIFSKMRSGVKSITPETDDLLLLELRAQYIMEMTQQWAEWAGPVDYVAICYDKFTELTVIRKDTHLVLTAERNVAAQELATIEASTRKQ